MWQTGLPARDLWVPDPILSYPFIILGRERAIVINVEHIKAIITANEVHLLKLQDSSSGSGTTPFAQELQNRRDRATAKTDDHKTENVDKILPLEFSALEGCLVSARNCLEDEVRDGLEHFLDDDADTAEMHLSDKSAQQNIDSTSVLSSTDDEDPDIDNNNGENIAQNQSNSPTQSSIAATAKPLNDVAELEMLLEAYFVQFDGILNKLSTLKEYVDDTEDYINITLNDKRNHLLSWGVMLSTENIVLSMFVVIFGLFGMNITIDLFDPNKAGIPEFMLVVGGGAFSTVLLYFVALVWMKHKRLLEPCFNFCRSIYLLDLSNYHMPSQCVWAQEN